MIVASFQSQYGIRLATELKNMSWREFSYFLEGLSHDTPLGRIVSVRAENDPEALKNFTPDQRRIRSEYRRKIALKKSDKDVKDAIEQFRQAFIQISKA